MQEEILVVDDEPAAIWSVARILAGTGNLRFATNGESALQQARAAAPDLIMLDMQMPGMSGFELFDALRAEPKLQDTPIIFLTNHCDTAFELSALGMGAADFIAKTHSAPLMLARVKAQLRNKSVADALRRNAVTDSLTGVASGRLFDQTLQREWQRGLNACEPISLLMVEIDHFQAYNDRYGTPEGDACLRRVGHALFHACQRPADFVARSAGDEFMLLLPQTARCGAAHVAQRALEAIAALEIPHLGAPTPQALSVSIGISCFDEASSCWARRPEERQFRDGLLAECSVDDLVLRADSALQRAQAAGRSQAMLLDIAAAQPMTPSAGRTVRTHSMPS
jgi:diguanylate cyclase (GGDEF)-like protein